MARRFLWIHISKCFEFRLHSMVRSHICRSSSLGFPVAFPKMWTCVSHPSLLVCQYVFPILSYPNPCEHLKAGGIIYHDQNQQADSLFISLQHDNLLNQVGYYLPQLPCNFLMSGEGEAKGQDRVSVSWQQLVWLNTPILWFQNVPNLCRSATKLWFYRDVGCVIFKG